MLDFQKKDTCPQLGGEKEGFRSNDPEVKFKFNF